MSNCYCKAPLVYEQDRAYWSRVRCAVRGVLAVAVLLATAVDELVTAVLGLPALTPIVRRWWRVIAEEYRRGSMGVIDADVIEDQDEEVEVC